jgi:hypothetical protein
MVKHNEYNSRYFIIQNFCTPDGVTEPIIVEVIIPILKINVPSEIGIKQF